MDDSWVLPWSFTIPGFSGKPRLEQWTNVCNVGAMSRASRSCIVIILYSNVQEINYERGFWRILRPLLILGNLWNLGTIRIGLMIKSNEPGNSKWIQMLNGKDRYDKNCGPFWGISYSSRPNTVTPVSSPCQLTDDHLAAGVSFNEEPREGRHSRGSLQSCLAWWWLRVWDRVSRLCKWTIYYDIFTNPDSHIYHNLFIHVLRFT